MLKYVNIAVAFLILTAPTYGQLVHATNCTYQAVRYAIDTAPPGGTVLVPAGQCTWTNRMDITDGIRLIGAGVDQTIIKNGLITDGNGDFCIRIDPEDPANDPHIVITGFTFDANLDGGCISIRSTSDTHAIHNFRIHGNKFMNTRDDGDSYMAVRSKGNCFGLIDNNVFDNNWYDFKIYGNDQNSWDQYPGVANIGTGNYLYIEANITTNCRKFVLTSGEGARWVYRHNSGDLTSFGTGSLIWDAHGDTRNDGVVAHEIYENTFTSSGDPFTQSCNMHDYRGGTGIIYNNSVQAGTSGTRTRIKVREEHEDGVDAVSDGYIWNNRNSRNGKLLVIDEADPFGCIAEDVNWWNDSGPWGVGDDPVNFRYGESVDRPVTAADDDCFWEADTKRLFRSVGESNWQFIYEPLQYPHPLRSKRPGKLTNFSA